MWFRRAWTEASIRMCLQTANQARTFETESSREREYDDDLNRDGAGGMHGADDSLYD